MSPNFNHLLLSNQQLLSIKDNFMAELQKASRGEKCSIPYLRHSLPKTSPLKDEEIFQVMTIGGSVFKTALVQKKGAETVIVSEREAAIPIFSTEAIFLEFFQKNLDPNIAYLSMNLAYPLKPSFHDNFLDGILLHGTKEHIFAGLTGEEIGTCIEAYIQQTQQKIIKVTVANDTVCLFLSEAAKETWNNTVAGIIGTGSNYAFGIDNQVINLECGRFDKFDQTVSGKLIDQLSTNPGKQLIEKEIAGAYLYKHFNVIAKENNLSVLLQSTKELSLLAKKNDGDASKLAQITLERSAQFAACQIAGIVEFKEKTTPGPFTFVMEGALFWSAYQYRAYLEKYLSQFGVMDKIIFNPELHHSIKGGIKLLIPE